MDTYPKKRSLCIRGTLFEFTRPLVMAVLNLTPDSFYEGSRFRDVDSIVARSERMIGEGADIIDVGAVSTRPGAANVSEEEEIRRLLDAVGAIRRKFPDVIISLDTFRPGVAKMMVRESGVDMINDISSGSMDEKMLETISGLQVPYIAMHMRGTPQTMQNNPVYEDVVNDIIRYFSDRLLLMRKLGIKDIIIDPGFGFGKTIEHNYFIASRIDEFRMLELPILVGFSRKSMIYRLLGSGPEDALAGTIALNTVALLKGVDILRVHDVREAKDAVRIAGMISDASGNSCNT